MTSVGCSFSGSRCCMRATYWDLVTMTTQPPQSVTVLKQRARERETKRRERSREWDDESLKKGMDNVSLLS